MEMKTILRTPSYMGDFHCIADKCSDNCCIGWEIDIDKTTAAYYKNVDGEFGEKLKACISWEDECSSFILDGERCPFLNKNNLCDIIINCGEEHLCGICAEHPRFYEWFDGIKEGGIGLCCEEAARIILSQDKSFSFVEKEIPYEDCDLYETALFSLLTESRNKIINLIQSEDLSLFDALEKIGSLCLSLQQNIDKCNYQMPFTEKEFSPLINKAVLFQTLFSLEEMDENRKPMLEKASLSPIEVNKDIFSMPDTEKYLRNIGVYFIWRYFLKSVFDYDVMGKFNLMLFSLTAIAYLFEYNRLIKGRLTFQDCVEISKDYSKEIEYSQENVDGVSGYGAPAVVGA